MMARRTAVVGCLLVWLVATQVRGAPGVDAPTIPELYPDCTAVFLGHVVQTGEPSSAGPTMAPGGGRRFAGQIERVVEFKVLRSWKGMPQGVAAVAETTAFTLGWSVSKGETYLVCAQADSSGRLVLNRASPLSRESTEAEFRWLQGEEARTQSQSDPELQAFFGARGAFESRNFSEVARWCEKLVPHHASPFYRDCQARLGVAYQKLQRFQEAVQILTRELSEPLGTTGAWDRQSAEFQRAEARFALAISLLGSGNYGRALEAIDQCQKNPAPHTCGNAEWQDAYRNAFYRGLVLERLGRYPEAVGAYLEAATGNDPDPTAAIRLADLYESARQWSDLVGIVRGLGQSVPRHLPRLVELRELQRRGDLDPLVQVLLVRRQMLGMPFEIHVRRWEWEAEEAARLLAREPTRSVPLLEQALQIVGDHGFVHVALGLCATKQAVAVLRGELQKSPEGGNGMMTLTYSLKLASWRGEAALNELSALYPAVRTFRAYPYHAHWFLEDGIEFPALPKEVRLPARLAATK